MAYEIKYRITFKTLQGDTCKVDFYIKDYSGGVTNLEPASNPFVLQEFNSDEDIYKPLRPQQATINFISQPSVSIDDFLSNSDTYCYVAFEFLSAVQYYWIGYLLQDDFQETWQDTNHIITLRATEGLGMLQSQPLTDNAGDELIGRFTPWQFIQYAAFGSITGFIEHKVISNLYHSSMDDTLTVPSIGQCYIDARTFSIGDGEYDNKYNVLNKVNSAFNQTMLQYKSNWYIFRPEELFMTPSQNLRQFNIALLETTISENRYDIEVGVNEEIKPIAPEMLRFINRPTKVDEVTFTYELPTELLCNQNLSRGDLNTAFVGYNTYDVDSWDLKAGTFAGSRESPFTSTSVHYRKETLDTYDNVIDNYLYAEQEMTYDYNWWQSCDIPVSAGDIITLSFEWRWSEGSVAPSPLPIFNVGQLLYKADAAPSFRAGLNDDGSWFIYPSTWDSTIYANQPFFKINLATFDLQSNGWATYSIESAPVIRDGIVRLLLTNTPTYNSFKNIWKNIQFDIKSKVNGLYTDSILGEYDKFTKNEDIRANFTEEIYLQDLNSSNLMGCIFDATNTLRTTPTWNRYRYQLESEPFKKQNLIANWERTRFHRNKIDVNLFGLKYDSKPIGLLNTIKFVDDDPNKLYYIANLKEIDFASATWQATLVEVYDNDRDFLINTKATYTNKTGSGLVPITLNYGQYFSVITGNKLRYTGTPTITVDFKGRVVGSITVSSTPVVVNFVLSNTSGILKTVNVTATTSPFAVDINLDVDNVVLATNNEIELTLSASITSLTVTSSYLIFNNNDSLYPTYKSGYIYK
jgi:hypothetical protein